MFTQREHEFGSFFYQVLRKKVCKLYFNFLWLVYLNSMSVFASKIVMRIQKYQLGYCTSLNHQILTTNIIRNVWQSVRGINILIFEITWYLKPVVSFALPWIHSVAKVNFNCQRGSRIWTILSVNVSETSWVVYFSNLRAKRLMIHPIIYSTTPAAVWIFNGSFPQATRLQGCVWLVGRITCWITPLRQLQRWVRQSLKIYYDN